MRLLPKKEQFPHGYAAAKYLWKFLKKTTKWALISAVSFELGIRGVDLAAKVSGYNDQYERNAPRIIKKLEEELNLEIKKPRITSSFIDCRAAMFESYNDYYRINNMDRNLLDYLNEYYQSTYDSLSMNRNLWKIFGNSANDTVAIHRKGTICLAPFDNPSQFTHEEEYTLAHEIMHSYVYAINPNFENTNTIEERLIRETLHEGIAMYASDLVYNGSLWIFVAELTVPGEQWNEDRLIKEKMAPYLLGTNFVSKVVNTIGFDAITLIAQHPPSTLDELLHPEDYAHSISARLSPR